MVMAGAPPRVRIAAECDRRGRRQVVRDCVSILTGGEPERDLLLVLGGASVPSVVAAGSRADAEMWSRVWAARGLLWALDAETVPDATNAIVGALHDPAWRVREKAAQAVARHVIDEALADVVALRGVDTILRVRSAADRAVHRLTAAGSRPPTASRAF